MAKRKVPLRYARKYAKQTTSLTGLRNLIRSDKKEGNIASAKIFYKRYRNLGGKTAYSKI